MENDGGTHSEIGGEKTKPPVCWVSGPPEVVDVHSTSHHPARTGQGRRVSEVSNPFGDRGARSFG